jgi:hypothetical protein
MGGAAAAGGGVGTHAGHQVEEDDNEFDQYRKRMMLAYKFRPNPMNNRKFPQLLFTHLAYLLTYLFTFLRVSSFTNLLIHLHTAYLLACLLTYLLTYLLLTITKVLTD